MFLLIETLLLAVQWVLVETCPEHTCHRASAGGLPTAGAAAREDLENAPARAAPPSFGGCCSWSSCLQLCWVFPQLCLTLVPLTGPKSQPLPSPCSGPALAQLNPQGDAQCLELGLPRCPGCSACAWGVGRSLAAGSCPYGPPWAAHATPRKERVALHIPLYIEISLKKEVQNQKWSQVKPLAMMEITLYLSESTFNMWFTKQGQPAEIRKGNATFLSR